MKTCEIFYQKRNREIMHDDVMVATTFHERASVKAPVKTFLAHTSVSSCLIIIITKSH